MVWRNASIVCKEETKLKMNIFSLEVTQNGAGTPSILAAARSTAQLSFSPIELHDKRKEM